MAADIRKLADSVAKLAGAMKGTLKRIQAVEFEQENMKSRIAALEERKVDHVEEATAVEEAASVGGGGSNGNGSGGDQNGGGASQD